jgi:hypothetical protein
MTARTEQLQLNIFKFLRAHRLSSNLQLNQAFWRGKNFRTVDYYMQKLAAGGFVRHVKLPELKPSNYYMLGRGGFNMLAEHKLTYEGETLYLPDKGNVNISGFFVKRLLIADIHIFLMRHYGDSLAAWMPDFEFEAKRKNYGIKTNDQKILAAVIPDGVILLSDAGNTKYKMLIFKYHHFEVQREKFSKRFRDFEHTWAEYPKLIMANNPEKLNNLRTWYLEDLRKAYRFNIAGKGLKLADVAKQYSFADFQTLQSSGKLRTTTLEP